jgi:hypothetical protein
MAARSTHSSRQPSDDPPPTAGDWFREFLSPAGIAGVVGIWLLLAPFALVYGDDDPSVDDIAVGVVVAAAGFIRLADALRERTLAMVTGVVAVWLIAAAAWLDQSPAAKDNDIVVATILGAAALTGAVLSHDER